MRVGKRIGNYSVMLAGMAAMMLAGSTWAAQKKGPLKVFILAGQSNMEGLSLIHI